MDWWNKEKAAEAEAKLWTVHDSAERVCFDRSSGHSSSEIAELFQPVGESYDSESKSHRGANDGARTNPRRRQREQERQKCRNNCVHVTCNGATSFQRLQCPGYE